MRVRNLVLSIKQCSKTLLIAILIIHRVTLDRSWQCHSVAISSPTYLLQVPRQSINFWKKKEGLIAKPSVGTKLWPFWTFGQYSTTSVTTPAFREIKWNAEHLSFFFFLYHCAELLHSSAELFYNSAEMFSQWRLRNFKLFDKNLLCMKPRVGRSRANILF